MSCQLDTVVRISDLDLAQLKEYLNCPNDDTWLSSHLPALHYAIAPLDIGMVFAHTNRFVLLEREKDPACFNITFKGCLSEDITAAVILTIANDRRLSPSCKWCIVLGTVSGRMHFFTESGDEIFSQQCHRGPVLALKAQTGQPASEEFHIIYQECECIVPGPKLIGLLLRVQSSQYRHTVWQPVEASQVEYMQYRKWLFPRMDVKDAVVVGGRVTTEFDHLLAVSNEDGVNASINNLPPFNSLTISVGQEPFVRFMHANVGFVQPVMAEVAQAVVSKLKSSLPNWLSGSTATPLEAAPPKQPTEPMHSHHGLYDRTRIGQSVCLSADRRHAAVADNLGRVTLIDCAKGIAVRVWKGYRDAKCVFLSVAQEPSLQKNRNRQNAPAKPLQRVQFLAIFSQRRLSLELWAMQRGPKVAAFSVARGAQLLINPNVAMNDFRHSATTLGSDTAYILEANGELKRLSVPFHCALTDGSMGSLLAKDVHLLNRIRTLARASVTDLAQLAELCASFETNEKRTACISMLVTCSFIEPQFLKIALSSLIDSQQHSVAADTDNDEPPSDQPAGVNSQMAQLARKYIALTELYIYLTANTQSDATTSQPNDPPLVQLNLSHTELESVQKFVDLRHMGAKRAGRSVHFDDGGTKSKGFRQYLAIFKCKTNENAAIPGGDRGVQSETAMDDDEQEYPLDVGSVALRRSKADCYSVVGAQMFDQFLERGKSLSGFVELARNSQLSSTDLMRLFLLYWLDRPFKYTNSSDLIVDLSRFTAVLQHICVLAPDDIWYDYNAVSNWWQTVREMLLKSSPSLQSLMAAMMCRTYATRFYKRDAPGDDYAVEALEEDMWEQVPQESAEWSLLIDKLENVAVLDAILGNTQSHQYARCTTLPTVPFDRPDISLGAIVSGGKGIVSEVTAKWLISFGCNPHLLLEPQTTEETSQVSSANASMDITTEPSDGEEFGNDLQLVYDPEIVYDQSDADAQEVADAISQQTFHTHWSYLRDQFPFSLQSGVILVHMAWLYFCHWSKELSQLSLLGAAIECLAAIRPADHSLKHGICCMIWNAHLTIPFEATNKVINKKGCLPNHSVCFRAIHLSDSLVADFLEHCNTFIQHFATSSGAANVELRHEELLQDGPVPIAQLALQQRGATAERLGLLSELNQVLHMIASLHINMEHPISTVFDAMRCSSFFVPINRPMDDQLPVPDAMLVRKRTEFLLKIVAASMDLVRKDADESVYLDEHVFWMGRVEQLARTWRVSIDTLKDLEIVELYERNWDDYADAQLKSATKTTRLGERLLQLAGHRLNEYRAMNHSGIYAEIASSGSLLTEFLDSLVIRKSAQPIAMDRLISLATNAFTCLADTNSREKRLAALLFDTCQRVNEMALLDSVYKI